MTRRRWIAENWDETSATLTGAQAEHLARVLRAVVGMEAEVVAGGRLFHARVASVSHSGEASEVRFALASELRADPALPVTLVMAVYKFDRMEWALEKATELGVAAIVPVIARRTEKHLAQAAGKRVERWRRIVHEASQQARRADVPVVDDPVPLADRVNMPANAVRIVLAEQERITALRDAIGDILARSSEKSPAFEIAIGPEGGWAPAEETLFATSGWRAVSLGPRILRAETAAIAALAVIASSLE